MFIEVEVLSSTRSVRSAMFVLDIEKHSAPKGAVTSHRRGSINIFTPNGVSERKSPNRC
jgi:hypothetical protein